MNADIYCVTGDSEPETVCHNCTGLCMSLLPPKVTMSKLSNITSLKRARS